MKILIGTFNRGKQKEFKRVLLSIAKEKNLALDILFPSELNLKDAAPETGSTFEENSRQKAEYYFRKAGVPSLTDDGGLEIPILDNAPGVVSRRWPGYTATDEELIDFAITKLKKYTSKQDRKAYLRTCVTYVDEKITLQQCEAIEGYIAQKPSPRRVDGYPYRSLFVVSSLDKFYDVLTEEEHNAVNHRERALRRLWERL